jgi:hypothetical protein
VAGILAGKMSILAGLLAGQMRYSRWPTGWTNKVQ